MEIDRHITITKGCFQGSSSLVSILGILFGLFTLSRFVKQSQESPNSANIYGIILCSVCVLNLVSVEGITVCSLYSIVQDSDWDSVNVQVEEYFDVVFHSSKVVLKLIVITQSFDRYILICQPHMKHILSMRKSLLASLCCFIIGGLNWFLYRKSDDDFWDQNEVGKDLWSLFVIKTHSDYKLGSNQHFQLRGHRKSMPATLIAYPIYHLLLSLLPCIFGVFFNHCTKRELRKACAFVNNQRRNAKFARIIKLSSCLTRMLLFYLIVDVANQISILYENVNYAKQIETTDDVAANYYQPVRRIFEMVDFFCYSLQATFISALFFWFTGKCEEEK